MAERRSVLIRSRADEVRADAALVVQEHVCAIAVDGTVREQHTDRERGLRVLRQCEKRRMCIPVRGGRNRRVGHVCVPVAILVHVPHERQIPRVVLSEFFLEVFHGGQRVFADSELPCDLVRVCGLLFRCLVEHVEVDGDGVLRCFCHGGSLHNLQIKHFICLIMCLLMICFSV
ncbi:Putative uncharacterized protein [Bifidobacterium animalis subsp. animalis IM386]|uniref:Uncharacterized protein n=1 Tax=Bifidobacterium animalis subsp. animalis IM386 TaxID=1402194 RepID=A0AAV2W1H1_9BIFI|nr:Putative uncharacterized protein [Bifidobacterium animalis subsp. animalis IM386]